jgi:hypothetical protein
VGGDLDPWHQGCNDLCDKAQTDPRILMTALILLLSLLALPLASCQSMSSPSVRNQPVPLPPGTEPAVLRAEEIGRAIFEQDAISGEATDALFRANIVFNEKRDRGWVTLREEGHWLVRFVGITENQDVPYAAYYDVTFPMFPMGRSSIGEIIRLDPPQPLVADQLAMFQARQTALRAMPGRCADRYNPVILSGNIAHTDGWVVYLLAATTAPDEIMTGGHFRVELSTTGTEVKQVLPLSKTCLRVRRPPDNPKRQYVASMTTHLISNTPIETHVYLSLLHKQPFYVGTDLGVWKVEEGRISYESKK